jgi:hypothetical protein|tara:strand:+ start:5677 stop:6210 length:534 start_codon:yes stop_codon:yes gene_type:complete
MEILIDTDILQENELSLDDYTWLYLTFKQELELRDILSLSPNKYQLTVNGFLMTDDIITQKFPGFFLTDFDAMFTELCDLYPWKVRTAQGVRVLRAKDPKANSNKKAKKKYFAVTKGRTSIHTYIIECLKEQLQILGDNTSYMQNLETWLNNYTWEKYENINKDETTTDNKRITRSL